MSEGAIAHTSPVDPTTPPAAAYRFEWGNRWREGQVLVHLAVRGVYPDEHLLKEGVHTVRVNSV